MSTVNSFPTPNSTQPFPFRKPTVSSFVAEGELLRRDTTELKFFAGLMEVFQRVNVNGWRSFHESNPFQPYNTSIFLSEFHEFWRSELCQELIAEIMERINEGPHNPSHLVFAPHERDSQVYGFWHYSEAAY